MFNTRNKSGISAHPCIILYSLFKLYMLETRLSKLVSDREKVRFVLQYNDAKFTINIVITQVVVFSFQRLREDTNTSMNRNKSNERLNFEERRRRHRQQWNMDQYPPIRPSRELVSFVWQCKI